MIIQLCDVKLSMFCTSFEIILLQMLLDFLQIIPSSKILIFYFQVFIIFLRRQTCLLWNLWRPQTLHKLPHWNKRLQFLHRLQQILKFLLLGLWPKLQSSFHFDHICIHLTFLLHGLNWWFLFMTHWKFDELIKLFNEFRYFLIFHLNTLL